MSERGQALNLVHLPAASLGALLRVLREELGEENGARVVRQIGLDSGEAFYELFRDWLAKAGVGSAEPEEMESERFWHSLSDFFTQLGWGRFESLSTYPGVVSLQFLDWVEARHDTAGSGCHFTAGLLAEILRKVAGGELAALELGSGSPGDGGARILIGSPDTLDALFVSMRDGAGFEEAINALA